jgi:hypothetical protein
MMGAGTGWNAQKEFRVDKLGVARTIYRDFILVKTIPKFNRSFLLYFSLSFCIVDYA